MDNTDNGTWERKDKLNARQSAIKAASLICEGLNTPSSTVIEIAQIYYKWLTQDQEWSGEPKVPEKDVLLYKTDVKEVKVHPVPTKDQLHWLELIENQHKYTKEQIYDKFNKYPKTKAEAVSMIQELKKQ